MTASGNKFVHLHCHTHYSLLDGANRISDLVAAAKRMNMPAVTITDHGNMFGVIEFYQTAVKAGIKPIIGMEAHLAPGDRRNRDAARISDASYHLLLLAETLAGYRNLMKLSSIAYREGYHYKPRIDREVLEAHREGLICTSTCLAAEIPQALMERDRAAADRAADWYLRVFGAERFFIELQDHGIKEQRAINPELIDIARKRGLGLIASNDVHYLNKDDAGAHDVLLCISTGRLVSDTDRMRFQGDQFYFKSADEMAACFPALPEALDNTVRIAERCNVELDFKKRHTPVYRPPEHKSPEQYLRELVYAGAAKKYGIDCKSANPNGGANAEGGADLPPEVIERIEYELGVIASKGFSSYFLIVWDFVRYARTRGIPAGARGSGCSAVVAYCLDLSLPDPLRYGLYFERFMDPDRDEMPDIDIDICQDGREEVLRYVRNKYGHVAQIITFGTLKARAAIRDVCRVMGVPLADADKLAKLVPEALKMTIEKAIEQEPELKRQYKEVAKVREVVDIAKRIEGLARHAGVHAAGVVIAEQGLENYVPVYRQSESKAKAARAANAAHARLSATPPPAFDSAVSAEAERPAPRPTGPAFSFHADPPAVPTDLDADAGALLAADITQYDGNTVEKVGLLKMDFLGLRTLSIMERARQLVGRVSDGTTATPHPARADGTLDLERINLQDPHVYGVFARGETQGIFQFESGGMRDVLLKMRPNRIEDLIAANALYRPGPMVNIDSYVARKHGEPWKTPHAIMDDVLAETYGIIVYQEQVARLVNRLGDIERKRAFRLAKAISKKKMDMIEAERGPFVEGAVKNGVDKRTAEDVFSQILPFGEYAFNKAHSTGYALIAYQTAYLKAYFPLQFMAAVLTFESQAQKIDAWYGYIEECKRMSIDVRPPDVNSSDADFTVVREAGSSHLCFGLSAIKGAGGKAVAAIMAARGEGGPFRDLFDFCERVDMSCVNRGVLEALIKAGAFDKTGAMRKGLMMALEQAMQCGTRAQADRRSGQLNMFESFMPAAAATARPIPSAEWNESELLANEKSVLGFYVTKHPLASHSDTLAKFASADAIDMRVIDDGSDIVLGGMISRVRYVVTKSGRNAGSRLAIAMFEDLSGGIEAVVFSEELERYRALVAPERLVFLRGKCDRKREEPSLRVTEIIPLEEAAGRLAASVIIRLSGIAMSRSDLETLRDICVRHRGDRPTYFEIASANGFLTTVRAGLGCSVAPTTAFIDEVSALLGPGHVQVVGPPRRVHKPAIVESRAVAYDEAESEGAAA